MEPSGNKDAAIHLFSSWGTTNLEFFCRIFRHENEDVLNQNWHLRLPLGVSAIFWEAHSSHVTSKQFEISIQRLIEISSRRNLRTHLFPFHDFEAQSDYTFFSIQKFQIFLGSFHICVFI